MMCPITPFHLWCSRPYLDSSSHTMWVLSMKKSNLILKLLLIPWLFKCVIDHPPSRAYVCMLEAELAKTREFLAQALKDRAHDEKRACKWFIIKNYFY